MTKQQKNFLQSAAQKWPIWSGRRKKCKTRKHPIQTLNTPDSPEIGPQHREEASKTISTDDTPENVRNVFCRKTEKLWHNVWNISAMIAEYLGQSLGDALISHFIAIIVVNCVLF